MIYNTIVIGKGLIGSAAAKYLSAHGGSVAIIGPDETTALQEGLIFSSHYDNSRIQRIIGKDKIWTLLNQQSANQYEELEKQSQIRFHDKVGCLYVNPLGADNYLDNAQDQSALFATDYSLISGGQAINQSFPDYHFPETAQAIFEPSPAGHINPRLLLKAQLEVFKFNGGNDFNETVVDVSYQDNYFTIQTLSGRIFQSEKVLLATGAFTNCFNLLENKLNIKPKGECTVWAKVSEQQAEYFKDLPSLLYEIDQPEIQNVYLVRPLLYPDGNYYLKAGANFPSDNFFTTLEEVQQWYKAPCNTDWPPVLNKCINSILPELTVEEWLMKKCIVSYTVHGKPYIGPVAENLYVAAAGNGYSAMCSDALGKIASCVVSNNAFPGEYDEADFIPVFKSV